MPTTRETPADAVVISHQLMIKAGLIRKLAAGLYTWMPLGLRVLSKVSRIIREEMDASGAQEISMPFVQPAELWQESGRWEDMGDELQRLQDRHGRDFCLGPTHEEVVTELVRNEITSYKQLPINLYQIQTKYRDERRPRFGVMRSREFVMKDAYSFHTDQDSLQETYQLMHDTYTKIFTRLGFTFRSVLADSGNIGGSKSHEFHVLADSGEDRIVFSSEGDYAANLDLAEALQPDSGPAEPGEEKTLVATPDVGTIKELCAFLKVEPAASLKTLLVLGTPAGDKRKKQALIALVLRGDHELNEVKAARIDGIQSPLAFASEAQIKKALGCGPGSIGPVDIEKNIRVIADRDAACCSDFVCGANRDGHHYTGVNWERDCRFDAVADLRNVVEGDRSPDGKGALSIKCGIEVGHIFQLGSKYSRAMNATVLNEKGRDTVLEMGCYGIGVSRIVAAVIEQGHDEHGIIWPENIAPFHLALIPLNAHKSRQVSQLADKLYRDLSDAGIEVLYDDRDRKTSPGVKFADMELIGIPHRLVISERGLEKDTVEYKQRTGAEPRDIPLTEVLDFLIERILAG